MANAAEAMPVEMLEQIFGYVDLPFLYNAMAVSRTWLLVGRKEAAKWITPLDIGTECIGAMYPDVIKKHSLNFERALQTFKWRENGLAALSWFQAGRHTAHLVFGDPKSDNSPGIEKRVFASMDGRVLLQSIATDCQAVNMLFSTDDATSFLQFWGAKNQTYLEHVAADSEYLGDFLCTEDLRPSFLINLPETPQLVDASLHYHAQANSTVCAFRSLETLATPFVEDSFSSSVKDSLSSLVKDYMSLSSAHRIDLALLSVKRQLTVLSVILELPKHRKLP